MAIPSHTPRTALLAAGLIAVATSTGCGTTFQADGLSLPFETLTESYAERKTYDVDVDADGETDITVTGVGAILSDRTDICSQGGVDGLDDVVAVQLIALWTGDPDVVRTNTSLQRILLDPEPDDHFVGMRVVQVEGGQVVADHVTANLLDPEALSTGELFITSMGVDNGELRSLAASFEAVLDADRTDPDAFDTDFNNDGTDDYRRESVDGKGRVAGAEICSLNVLP